MGCRPWEGFTEEEVAKMRVEKYLGVRARRDGLMWEGLKRWAEGVDLKRSTRKWCRLFFNSKFPSQGFF